VPQVAKAGKFSIKVYLNDHPPAHVHVRFARVSIKVFIAEDTVTLGPIDGKASAADRRAALQAVADNLDACLEVWRKYHAR
jgi:hypothetical protein